MPSLEIIEADSEDAFLSEGLTCITEHAVAAIAERGSCILGLSGGSTPRPVYDALGRVGEVDWSRVWLFLVDERYVPDDHPKSNQSLLRSTLLRSAPVPESQLLFPDTSLPLDACVRQYDAWLTDLLRKGSLDVVTLGLGQDGHIASLFPLLSEEAFGPLSVIHTMTTEFAIPHRITVTLPVLKSAKQAVFFLKGAEKKRVLEEMVNSEEDEKRWPAKAVLHEGRSTVLFFP